MPVKSDPEAVPAEVGALPPPADYCPGRTSWVEDREDVFYVAPELRAYYGGPEAPPTSGDMRRLWAGGVRLNRVIRDGKRHVWAPPIKNTGNLALLRPASPDEIAVDPLDELHTAAWRHELRRKWADRQLRAAEDSARREAARARCRICSAVLIRNESHYGPWTKGATLCPACAAAVELAGAMRHLDEHRQAIAAWLEPETGPNIA